MKIIVSKIINSNQATIRKEGLLVYVQIKQYISDDIVEVDFSDIQMVVSSFLNASIGKLYGDFDDNLIDTNLKIMGLSDDDMELLEEEVIPNAKSFYKNNLEIETIENKIIEE